MLKQFIRAFALGLIVAGGILGVTYYLDTPTASMDEAAMKKELTNNGYFIYEEKMNSEITDLQYEIAILENRLSELENTDNPSMEDESSEDEAIDDEAELITIEIMEGMQVADVTQLLLNTGIIDDQASFITTLEESERSRYIQVGSFELSPNMSEQEIVSIITGE